MSMVAPIESEIMQSSVDHHITAGYSSDSSGEFIDVSQLDPETLRIKIKAQVEYYFSQQNLERDVYMTSQMNQDGYIPLSVISNFKRVKSLTSDVNLLVESITDSTVCELSSDKTMLKCSWKRPARTTVIIRDVHEDATEDDIRGLFADAAFKLVSIRSDVGQTWFVTMETEEDAKAAMEHLFGKSLLGSSVRARMKSESMHRSMTGSNRELPTTPHGQAAYFSSHGQQQYGSEYGHWPVMEEQMTGFGKGTGHRGDRQQRGMKPTRAGGPRKSSDKSPSGRKRKNTVKKQANTPVFQPQDFPSLSMGQMSLDEPSASPVEPVTQDTETRAVGPAVASSSASWAAAAAKPAVEAPVVVSPESREKKKENTAPSTARESRPKNKSENAHKKSSSNNNNHNTNKTSANVVSKTDEQGQRSKRGWEAPGVSNGKATAEEIVNEVVDKIGESTPSTTETTTSTKASSAKPANTEQQTKTWGSKLSFAEVIKTPAEAPAPAPKPATVAAQHPAPATSAPVSKKESSFYGSKRVDQSALERNWRGNDVQKA